VHLYSELLGGELYLINRHLPPSERPTGAPCYTIPEAEVLRFLGTTMMAVVPVATKAGTEEG
jgi:hypothetical protein